MDLMTARKEAINCFVHALGADAKPMFDCALVNDELKNNCYCGRFESSTKIVHLIIKDLSNKQSPIYIDISDKIPA